MHSSTLLLALLGTAASVASADLAGQLSGPIAIVQNVITIAMPPTGDKALGRRSDRSCSDSAKKVFSKISSGMSPLLEPTFTSKLSSYLSEHPEITTAPSGDMCSATGGPSITGPLGSEVTKIGSSMAALWSSITPDVQSMWSECSTVEGISSALADVCPSMLADITGKPKGATQTQKGAAPRETGAIKVALGVAGIALAALN
ncbi:hypothetical protein HRG_003901 [Hirsutella rhossiliensis]|uniref:Infection structure specific protein n=1 Tax=Hirsutella rhossiliensis TaxID=111463 RepID=A0A9P8SLJ7_9HYPO|nr:uncharacterized protein HRG_03901 [Hirsutella rhossiliensis]KAH0965885.1 hypothetical protein HRG_03901 [Hirsutella rhossiliensis]